MVASDPAHFLDQLRDPADALGRCGGEPEEEVCFFRLFRPVRDPEGPCLATRLGAGGSGRVLLAHIQSMAPLYGPAYLENRATVDRFSR
jgi:hypothetical protein